MALPPLTHHEILRLVEPFSRRGRRVDLDACDRMARRIAWRPIQREGGLLEAGGCREELALENPYAGVFRLTRRLVPASGAAAELAVEGADPATLLAVAESVAPERQFRRCEGTVLALCHLVENASSTGPLRLQFVRALAEVGGLTFEVALRSGHHLGAHVEIRAPAGDPIALPEDLLSVIGWDWGPLRLIEPGQWSSSIRVRGRGRARHLKLEERAGRTAAHLAATLSRPPREFHRRFLAARWGASLRRGIPIWTFLLIIGVALAVPRGIVDGHPGLRLLVMNGPLFILALSFTLQERARIELPPIPRPLTMPSWRPSEGT